MSLLVQRSKTNIGENLIRTIIRFLQMSLWIIPPPQGFTPDQSLGITGRPGLPRITGPQIGDLSGSNLDDMIFNNTGEVMAFNNSLEEMEFNK